MKYLENKTAEFAIKKYLTRTSEIVSTCEFRCKGVMLFINSFTLGIIRNNNRFYLLDSHKRDWNGNPAIDGTAILLKFNSLLFINKYIKKMYYEKQPVFVYFQIQFETVRKDLNFLKNFVQKSCDNTWKMTVFKIYG